MRINMIHWNCNSLNNKIDEIKDFCFNHEPHIISLNETKLNDNRADYVLSIDKYNLIHKSRYKDKNGAGGVALLIREDLKFSECKLFDEFKVAINITMDNKDICV